MSIVSLNDINNIISEMSISELGYAYTPPISSLKTVSSSNNICSSWDREVIFNTFFSNEYPLDRAITNEDLIDKMCNFILGDNIPNGQDNTNKYKDFLSKYFSEDMKLILLNKYLDQKLKSSKFCYVDPDDISQELYYNPRYNNIPLKYDNGNKMEIPFDNLKNILLGNIELSSSVDKAIIMSLISNDDFFNGPWLPSNIVKLKENLLKERTNLLIENHTKNYDAKLVNNIKLGGKDLKYKVDDIFLDKIISEIPAELNQLEKSIYLYSKLCRIFTYDSAYFLNDHSTPELLDANNMNNYNGDNNSIICHNFTYMLSCALKKLGVDSVKENIKFLYNSENFNGHSNLLYLVDDIAIFADSTKEVTGGDLEVHKFSNELNGIRCEMYSAEKQAEFSKAKQKVENILKYEDLMIETYLPSKEVTQNLSMIQKYELLNNYLNQTEFTNVDFISYAKKLINILDLNVDTKIMYDKENLNNLFLKITVIGDYMLDGSRDKLEYIIDSNSKQVMLGNEFNLSIKESLTSRVSR